LTSSPRSSTGLSTPRGRATQPCSTGGWPIIRRESIFARPMAFTE